MKLERKAALYSAIVFPGSGYFLTTKKIRGWLSLTICIGIILILMKEAMYKAQIIAEKIVRGEVDNNFLAIQQEIQNLPSIYSETFIMFTYFVLAVIWIGGIIDSYRIAKQETGN